MRIYVETVRRWFFYVANCGLHRGQQSAIKVKRPRTNTKILCWRNESQTQRIILFLGINSDILKVTFSLYSLGDLYEIVNVNIFAVKQGIETERIGINHHICSTCHLV